MKKEFFKAATLPCAMAVALVGGSLLFSCSGDDETGVDESDFFASQFETLASRRMTRSAEGQIDLPLTQIRAFTIKSEEKTLCSGVKVKLCASSNGAPDAINSYIKFYAEITEKDTSIIASCPLLYASGPEIPASAGHGDKTFYANVLYKGEKKPKHVEIMYSFDWSSYLQSGETQHFPQ